jgi:pimeloyl-ACP methyl ester carboxylesterase
MTMPPDYFPVLAHSYTSSVPNACFYEYLLNGSVSDGRASRHPEARNALVFVGGLGDGPHTVLAVRALAKRLAEALPQWPVFEIRLSSSFGQWGFGSLEDDVREISEVVKHIRHDMLFDKVVLMGHSTGCQVRRKCAVRFRYGLQH